MSELLSNVLSDGTSINIILIMGLAIFFGTAGARIFQKFRIPQVVGYVVIGLLAGESGFGLISRSAAETLAPFNMFALGVIGFMIGGELRHDVFKKYGRQFFIILCSEGLAAFALVGFLTTVVGWYFTKDLQGSVAMGIVLGAIASATAPAATADVLWEYKTRGPLTSTVLGLVALDDGLALLLYAFASSIAAVLLGQSGQTIGAGIVSAVLEICGAVILGAAAGLLLSFIVRRISMPDKALGFTVASVLIVIGFSIALKLSSILAAMTLGATIANFAGRKRQSTFEVMEKFTPPVYVLFFVLAGAHLVLGQITGWMLVMVFVYLIGRTTGKIFGSWFGAGVSGASEGVRKYLGFCLLSQAGVAIGLAIISSRLFAGQAGHAIIVIVMTTTFVVEVFGPMFVKIGVKKAGEIGLNITEEDLMKVYTVKDVMDDKPNIITEGLLLQDILEVFSRTDSVCYPVIDNQSRVTGIITIADIKEMFASRDVAGWLLACDVAGPVHDRTTPAKPLEEAIERMRRYDLESIPVVDGMESNRLVGILDYRKTLRKISAEVLQRRKQADEMAAIAG